MGISIPHLRWPWGSASLGQRFRIFRYLFLLRQFRGRIAILMLTRTALMVVSMAIPLFTKVLIDRVIAFRDWVAFYRVAGGMALVLGLSLALALAMTYMGMYLDMMVRLDLQRRVQAKWQKLPVTYFQQWGTGEHLYRSSSDIQNVVNTLLRVVPDLLILHLEFVLFLVIAMHLHFRLTMYYLLAFPALLVIEYLHSQRVRPLQFQMQDASGAVGDAVSQYVTGVVTTKVFLREKYLSRQYVGVLVRLIRLGLRKWNVDRLFTVLAWACNTLWAWGVIFYGFALVIRGELTLGALVALKLYLTSLTRPTEEIAGLIQSIMVGSVSAERLEQTLLTAEEPSSGCVAILTRPISRSPNAIEIDNVTFGYQPDAAVLRSAKAAFSHEGLYGMSGPSGGGKSTIISLIARFYEPWSGCIRLNGRDISQLSLRQVRSELSIAPQEAFLFNGSIRENISYGDREAPFEEIVRAAKMADVHDFISSLKDGYDFMLSGQRGLLSAGQKQRIGLARAFLKKSPILILDEGLNAVDEASRMRIMAALREARGRTILLVTHDPGLLRLCDATFAVIDRRIETLAVADASAGEPGFLEYLRLRSQYEPAASGSLLGRGLGGDSGRDVFGVVGVPHEPAGRAL